MGEQGRKALVEIRSRPGYSDKLSKVLRARYASGEIFGFKTPENVAKSYETRLKNGTLIPPGSGRGITGFRKGLDHYTRSTLEANFARILCEEGIPYLYEPVVAKLADGSVYVPDFYLERSLGDWVPAGWVELKGWAQKDGSLLEKTAAKIQGFEAKIGEKVAVLVQSSPMWEEIQAQFEPRIVLWETPKRNLRTHPEIFDKGS